MGRGFLVCGVVFLSGCALFMSGSAKVVSQTPQGGTVEMTGNFNPRDSEEKAYALIEKHCGPIGYTVRGHDRQQITYTCGRTEAPAAANATGNFPGCIPVDHPVENGKSSQCCTQHSRHGIYGQRGYVEGKDICD